MIPDYSKSSWAICILEKVILSYKAYVFKSVDFNIKAKRCRSWSKWLKIRIKKSRIRRSKTKQN